MRKVFHFNPTCEIAQANGSPYYQAPALLRDFEEELAPIMMAFAAEGDHVINERPVSQKFEESMVQTGFSSGILVPKRQSIKTLQNTSNQIESEPWGWSPAEINYFSEYRPHVLNWANKENMITYNLAERKHAVGLVNRLITENQNELFPKKSQLPTIVQTLEQIENHLKKHQQTILKSPLSSSGRGLQVIRKSRLNESNIRWITTNLKQQKYLVAEPLHKKKRDVSFQFEFKETGEIAYMGTSSFKTNSNGQYLGHYINQSDEASKIYSFANELHFISKLLKEQLTKSLFKRYYRGFLGIDAIIYEESNQLKIQPCLEINARYTMGTLSKYLEKKIHPESKGIFQVYYHPTKPYSEFIAAGIKKNPPMTKDGKLQKGTVSLTDPIENSKFGAYLTLL